MFAQEECQVCLHVMHFSNQSLPVEDIRQGQTPIFRTLFLFLLFASVAVLSGVLSEDGDSVLASGLPGLETGLAGLPRCGLPLLFRARFRARGLMFRGACLRGRIPSEEFGEFFLSPGVFLSVLLLGIIII